jgi:hypothetical protein
MNFIVKALAYPVGLVEQIAIDESFSAAQRLVAIAGTATLAFAFVGVLIWPRH